jgi:hypothetical protein
MTGIFDRPPRMRWPRAQKFRLSSRGADAEASYREIIVAARAVEGRTSYDAARAAWAGSLPSVQPNDGSYLVELQSGPRTLHELALALDACGATREEVKAAIERLADAGMVEAIPAPVVVDRYR